MRWDEMDLESDSAASGCNDPDEPGRGVPWALGCLSRGTTVQFRVSRVVSLWGVGAWGARMVVVPMSGGDVT